MDRLSEKIDDLIKVLRAPRCVECESHDTEANRYKDFRRAWYGAKVTIHKCTIYCNACGTEDTWTVRED